MSTDATTIDKNAAAEQSYTRDHEGGLSFVGVLHSELIKLASLRSIRWVTAVTLFLALILSLGLSALNNAAISGQGMTREVIEAQGGDQIPSFVQQSATFSTGFTQLVIAILGVLAITGEYSTGMIRSTMTAGPKRLPVFAAKALIITACAFVIGLICSFGGGLIATLTLDVLQPGDLFNGKVAIDLLNNALFLALVALMAFALGTLVRNAAGAIAGMMGLLFVLPIAANIAASTQQEWLTKAIDFLPSNLARVLYSSQTAAEQMAMQGGGVGYGTALIGLLCWTAVLLIPAAVLLKSRDV